MLVYATVQIFARSGDTVLSVKLDEHGMVTFSVRDMRVSSEAVTALEAVKHVDGNALVSIGSHATKGQIAQVSAER